MIRRDTEKLSLPGGRRVGQPGHGVALQFLEARMAEIGLKPFKNSSFKLPYGDFTNLAGVVEGTDSDALPVLVGAHYDSAIDGPCSDDNAVSVAVILRLAEVLAEKAPRRKTIVAFFDAEEKPNFLTENMGSVRFQQDHCKGIEFACVVILDMIGHDFQTDNAVADTLLPGINDIVFVLGSESHKELSGIVENTSQVLKKLRVIPILNRYTGDRSDHAAFRKAGQPYLFISRGWGKHSHTPEDNMSWINFSGVERVFLFLKKLMETLDGTQMELNRGGTDPYEYEIRMIRRAVGWPLPILLFFLGFRRMFLKSRSDLDFVVGRVLKLAKF